MGSPCKNRSLYICVKAQVSSRIWKMAKEYVGRLILKTILSKPKSWQKYTVQLYCWAVENPGVKYRTVFDTVQYSAVQCSTPSSLPFLVQHSKLQCRYSWGEYSAVGSTISRYAVHRTPYNWTAYTEHRTTVRVWLGGLERLRVQKKDYITWK